MRFEQIPANGIRLHVAVAGPVDGEPVFLLHGFPEAWFGWEAQIGPLTQAGFRVIVPDQRGYNLSGKPQGVDSYRMPALAADAVGLADAFGYGRFNLAGHDFGAMVAWNLALRHPERVTRLAIANVPHPAVMGRFLRRNLAQMRKSWYAFFFQIPRLPERLVRANDWRMLMRAMPGALSDDQRDRYRQAWAQPGAITAMINWYRATMRAPGKRGETPPWRRFETLARGSRRSAQRAPRAGRRVRAPTLVLWGQQDPHLSYAMAPASVDLCDNGRLVTFPDATHWVQHDEADEVSLLLIEHFAAGGPGDG